jgi:hypothetical protein
VSVFALLSLISFGIFLLMGTFIFHQNRKAALNRAFAGFCLFMSVWAFCEFMYRQADSYATAYFWTRAVAIPWPVATAFLLYFVLIFTEKARWLKHKLVYLLVFGPAVVVPFIDLSTDLISSPPIK